jgi:hypothetical protein
MVTLLMLLKIVLPLKTLTTLTANERKVIAMDTLHMAFLVLTPSEFPSAVIAGEAIPDRVWCRLGSGWSLAVRCSHVAL